MHTLTANKKDI